MNIFFLDKTPEKSAEYHCDKHVVKMILETAQMLSTAINKYAMGIDSSRLYKNAHPKHPSTIWMGSTRDNFMWGLKLGQELSKEYTKRYGKKHKSSNIIDNIIQSKYYEVIPTGELTTPPQCMPDEFKHDDYVIAYRNYYKGAKRYFAKWDKLKNTPDWWEVQ